MEKKIFKKEKNLQRITNLEKQISKEKEVLAAKLLQSKGTIEEERKTDNINEFEPVDITKYCFFH